MERIDATGGGRGLAQGAVRGAAPVGQLAELPPVEMMAIVYLRSWCEDGAARLQIGRDFALLLDGEAAGPAAAQFDDLMRVVLGGARRPLMRHGIGCACFGGDESAFANLVAAAVAGDREEALLFAALILNGYAAFEAARLAEALSDTFLRVARAALSVQAARGATRH